MEAGNQARVPIIICQSLPLTSLNQMMGRWQHIMNHDDSYRQWIAFTWTACGCLDLGSLMTTVRGGSGNRFLQKECLGTKWPQQTRLKDRDDEERPHLHWSLPTCHHRIGQWEVMDWHDRIRILDTTMMCNDCSWLKYHALTNSVALKVLQRVSDRLKGM